MMKKLKTLFTYTFIMFLASCSAVKEGFENQKKNSSDEFMVEKKSPLVMPPNHDVLPVPNDNKDIETSEKKIKNYIISDDLDIINTDNFNKTDKSFEKFLLDKIKDN